MFIERREFYRIYTDISYHIGEYGENRTERINISAGGSAFLLDEYLSKVIFINEIIEFYFNIGMKKFMLNALVLRTEVRNGKKYACICFKSVPERTRNELNDLILSIGGYLKDDKEARAQNMQKLMKSGPVKPVKIEKTSTLRENSKAVL
jgi:c-di-GMP-binding flagellar brake protein YcgR